MAYIGVRYIKEGFYVRERISPRLASGTGNGMSSTVLKFPEPTGHGRSKDEARESLDDAIALILEDRREDGLRGVPKRLSGKP